jgi:hypothetical protein
MARVIEVDDEGNILVPREIIGRAKPHTRYEVDVEGNTVTLRRLEGDKALMADAQEWIRSFLDWVDRPRPSAPILPDEALRRESIYD